MLLAIDSSTAWMGVGLYDRGVLSERVWWVGTDHSRQLMPAIEDVLREQGIAREAVSAVAVAVGPGTFNGVRVGVTTAKLLAYGLGVPIVGVDTLEVHAAPFRGLVRPVLDAARGEVATALFRDGARLEADRVAAPEELFVDQSLVVGELKPEWREKLGERAAPPALCLRRPGVLAELAATRLARGESDDAASLAPVYLRQPHITPPRR